MRQTNGHMPENPYQSPEAEGDGDKRRPEPWRTDRMLNLVVSVVIALAIISVLMELLRPVLEGVP